MQQTLSLFCACPMPRTLRILIRRRLSWLVLLLTVWLLCSGEALALTLVRSVPKFSKLGKTSPPSRQG